MSWRAVVRWAWVVVLCAAAAALGALALVLGVGSIAQGDAQLFGIALGMVALAVLVGQCVPDALVHDPQERNKLAVPPAWWQWVLIRARHLECLLLGHGWRWIHPSSMRPVCRRCGCVGRRERSTMKGCEV